MRLAGIPTVFPTVPRASLRSGQDGNPETCFVRGDPGIDDVVDLDERTGDVSNSITVPSRLFLRVASPPTSSPTRPKCDLDKYGIETIQMR